MALQLESVGATVLLLDPDLRAQVAADEVVLIVAALMGLFAILFGSRRADRAGDNAGLVLTIAVEAVVKLAALLAVPLVAYDRSWLLDSVHDAHAAAIHGSHLFLHFCVGLAASAVLSIASPEGVTGVRLWIVALPFIGGALVRFGKLYGWTASRPQPSE